MKNCETCAHMLHEKCPDCVSFKNHQLLETAARLDELRGMRRRLKAATRRTCADNVHAVIADEIAAIDRRIKNLGGYEG